jgi:hypothetical protein
MKKVGRIVLIDYSKFFHSWQGPQLLPPKYLAKCNKITKKHIHFKRFAYWDYEDQIWKPIESFSREIDTKRGYIFLTKKDLIPIFYALLYM